MALPENPQVLPRIPQRYSRHSAPSAAQRIRAALVEFSRRAKPADEPATDLNRLAAIVLVDESRDHYMADRNPLWVWLAIAEATTFDLPLPAWALALRRSSDAAAVTRVLGLGGKDKSRTAFTKLKNARRDIGLAAYVLARHTAPVNPRDGVSITAAIDRLSKKMTVSTPTIRRAWDRYGPALSSATAHLTAGPQ